MDGMYGRRDVNGKANAGLMGDGSTNINVVGVGAGNGTAPTAF